AVFRRRVAYFTTVWLTLLLVAFPVLDRQGWLPSSLFGWQPIPEPLSTGLSELLKSATHLIMPRWTAWWQASYSKFSVFFMISAWLLLLLFFKQSHELQKTVFARAEYAWRRV